MTAPEIIAQLRSRGVDVTVADGRLRIEPKSKVSAEMMDRIRRNKAAIVAILNNSQSDEPYHGPRRVTGHINSRLTPIPNVDIPPGVRWFCGSKHNGHSSRAAAMASEQCGWRATSWYQYLAYRLSVCDIDEHVTDFREAMELMIPKRKQ